MLERMLVACSAGIDSTVLVDVLARLDLELSIGHVNHGLRGAESEADEAFVRELGRERGLEVLAERVEPGRLREGCSSRQRPTLQEAARQLRYEALERMRRAAGAAWIATGHNADDQAETLLLRLVRGSGPDGLGGIPPVSGHRVRPLLRVARAEIEAYARRRGLRWREDASNASPAYARNRMRRVVRALEADFNPRLLRAIGDLAEAQRQDSAWITELVEREAGWRFAERDGALAIDAKDWSELPEALALRLAREALRRCGARRHVSRVHLERMVAFLRQGRAGTRIELPGGLVLARQGEGFRLRAKLGN